MAVYIKNNLQFSQIAVKTPYCDVLALQIHANVFTFLLITLYRSPTVSLSHLQQDITDIIEQIKTLDRHYTIITGDFNHDLNKSQPLKSFRDYYQLINVPTTIQQTLIHHFYINPKPQKYKSGTFVTYYSYHNPFYVNFN